MANRLYHSAKFLTSAATLIQAPKDQGFEVAFAGRSNSGKSSAINALCNQSKLCRTSKTPGRTQLINFFELDNQRRFVDLPGYGYAAAPDSIQERWQHSITDYLKNRVCLQGLILLMDIRTPLTRYDTNVLHWNATRKLPMYVLLNKSDKFNRGPALEQLHLVQQQLKEYSNVAGIQTFSATKRQGLKQVYSIIDIWFQISTADIDPS